MAAWLSILAMGLPWAGALAVWAVGDRRPRAQGALAVGSSLLAGVAALALLPLATDGPVVRLALGGVFGDFTLVPDGLGVLLTAIATVIGSLAVVFSLDYMAGERQLGRYYALVLLFIGAMVGLVLSGSLLQLFLFWEMVGFCSYALISFHNDDRKAVAGGIKALVVTQLGGVGLLVGVLVAGASLGTYEVRALLANGSSLPPEALALIAFGFLAAAAAKSAQVPFHTWLPAAMEAPTPVSALIHAATMVNAGVYLVARFYPAFAPVPGWTAAVVTIGVVSAVLAGIMALVSNDLKRALAYSTISQLGYLFYAVGLGAVFASQVHLLSHAIFKALLFLGAGAVIHAVGTRDLRQMGGLGRKMPFVRTSFAIGALALAGVPVLNGFWSKELILEAGLSSGMAVPYGLMLLGAGLTALYSFRLVWLVFYGEPRGEQPEHDAPPAMRWALGPLAVGALGSWLLVGQTSDLLASTLPLHHLEALPLAAMVLGVVTEPGTALALLAVALGLAAWWWRAKLAKLVEMLRPLGEAAVADFGFEWLNHRIVQVAGRSASALRGTQGGVLSWNVLGIVGGLAAVLLVLARGGPA